MNPWGKKNTGRGKHAGCPSLSQPRMKMTLPSTLKLTKEALVCGSVCLVRVVCMAEETVWKQRAEPDHGC